MSALPLYWKPLSRPTDHATGHAVYLCETSLLHELRGGDAAVSAPAYDDDFFQGIELFHSRGEAPQWNMNCTWDVPSRNSYGSRTSTITAPVCCFALASSGVTSATASLLKKLRNTIYPFFHTDCSYVLLCLTTK